MAGIKFEGIAKLDKGLKKKNGSECSQDSCPKKRS